MTLPDNRAVAVLLAILLLAAVWSVSGGNQPVCDRCNVVLVSIDPLRQDQVGTYSPDLNTTPSIDRLAKQGIVFENAFSHSTHTLPATFSTLTSTYPVQHGVDMLSYRERAFSKSFTTIAEILSRNGYQTVAVTGGLNIDREHGVARGFTAFRTRRREDGKTAVARRLINFSQDTPFFLYLQTFATHDPYLLPPNYTGDFGPVNRSFTAWARQRWRQLRDRFDTWSNLTTAAAFEKSLLRFRKEYFTRVEAANLSRTIVTSYRYRVRQADDVVNRTIQMLREQGVMEDTLVIVTSQHGEEFDDHGRWTHSQFYNEVLKVPLILWLPGDHAAERIDEYVGLVDVVPTILDVTGIEAESAAQRMVGRSLTSLIAGRTSVHKPYILATRTPRWGALIDAEQRIKYITNPRANREAVYNLSADPAEKHPLRNDSLIARMRHRFRDIVQRYRGPNETSTPTTFPYFG